MDVSLKKKGSVRINTYIIGIVLFQPIDARGLFFNFKNWYLSLFDIGFV